jgi:acyl-CoA hydrolase
VSLQPKPPTASRVTFARIMDAADTNLHGNVHGGVIMKYVDDAAGTAAARHSAGRAVTAAMDEMTFLVPVHVGDIVTARAQVNWAGRSSMEVGVRVEAQRWDEAGAHLRHVASAYLVYVAVDDDGEPRRVPPLSCDTEEERHRLREAEIRRQTRLARREAILRLRDERDQAARVAGDGAAG